MNGECFAAEAQIPDKGLHLTTAVILGIKLCVHK